MVGTNKPDAIETVGLMLEDLQQGKVSNTIHASEDAISALLAEKGVRYVSFADWKYLDQIEVENGEKVGKPREKMTTVVEMLTALEARGV